MTAIPAARAVSDLSYDATGAASSRLGTLASHGVILLQLVLVFAVVHEFDLERSSGFHSLTALIAVGFVIHASLAPAYRMPFFLALSLAAFGVVLGSLALGVTAAGLALIAICHLPIAFNKRVALLLIAGSVAAVLLVRGIPGMALGVERRPIAVLASMFMFRLIIYVYDLRHERTASSVWTRLSYFFLLPNAAFPFFPVVDYGAFRRNYYDRPPLEIYQRGVRLILRGAIHLLIYRFVYYHLSRSPDAVYGIKTVAIYFASAWLVYLHVSGLFHLIAGILCLFGFNLPETNRLYFFASSPNDLWRRVNVYWKDFMLKIFYLPAYKALQKRKASMRTSMISATLVVFGATWLLHSYQSFWLLGRFSLTLVDAVFWGVFGALVVANTLMQLRPRPRVTTAQRESWTLRHAIAHVLKVMGMFTLMSAMFSWWSTRDPLTWIYLVRSVGESRPAALMLFFAGVIAVFLAGVAAHYAASRGWTLHTGESVIPFRRSVTLTLAGALLLLGLSRPEVQQRLGRYGHLVLSLERERLNARDAAIEDRAYYEALITNDQPATLTVDIRPEAGPDFVPIRASKAARLTGDDMIYELLPSLSTRNRGADLVTNSFGIRDQEYSAIKPPRTYRIALIGASVIMASGTDQKRNFEALTEEHLNREPPSRAYTRYEILNFGVAGYGFQQFVRVTDKALKYQPDVLLVGALAGDHGVSYNGIAELAARRIPLDPELMTILQDAGIGRSSGIVEIKRKLKTGNTLGKIRAWAYRRIAEKSRAAGVLPVFMYLPRLESDDYPPGFEEMSADAKAAGMRVLDLRGVYDGRPRADYMIGPRDDVHPNPAGHRVIADRLYTEILAHSSELGLGRVAQNDSTTPRPSVTGIR